MLQPTYKNHSIYSIDSLAKTLGVKSEYLIRISEKSNSLFYLKITKKNRCVTPAKEPLKSIHQKIQKRILSKVKFPDYLQGSIKNKSSLSNAQLHKKAELVIQLDIKNFYPSVTEEQIFKIWKYFFHFSDKVSNLLSTLITYEGFLVQGIEPSSYIANLVFYNEEYKLFEYCSSKKLIYSRYVDDISISSKIKLPNTTKTEIIKKVNSMIRGKGFKLNHKKTKISDQSERMEVTGNVINDGAKVSQEYKDLTYKAIQEVSKNTEQSIKGRISYIRQTRPKEAQKLYNKLK